MTDRMFNSIRLSNNSVLHVDSRGGQMMFGWISDGDTEDDRYDVYEKYAWYMEADSIGELIQLLIEIEDRVRSGRTTDDLHTGAD